MIRQIKQKPWSKNKNKMLYFWNKHTFSPLHRIEQQRETAGADLYYIDYKHKASISAFCVFGTCPTPPTVT